MAIAKSKLEMAKKAASKLKTKKKSASARYQSQGQNAPQSKAWTEPSDESVVAKPVGARWTNDGAKRLGKKASAKPTATEIEKYKNKTFSSKGETHRYLYSEKRVDKSDKVRSAKFKEGGSVKQTSPQSDAYKKSNDKRIEAKPVGWRFKGNNYNEPSERVINREKNKSREDRNIYFETRKDKSDHDFYAKLEDGGTMGAGSFAKGGATFGGRQYDPYNKDMDGQKQGKPIGYRFTDSLAKRLGRNAHSKPTNAEVEKYLGRGVYFENRQDKSDAKPSKNFISLAEGGTLGAGSFAKGGATFGGRQYDPYNKDMDGQKQGKPIGYRFTDSLAKRLGRNAHSKPTNAEVEKYLGRGVYFENRQDKSDAQPSKNYISLAKGGTIGKTNTQRVKNLVKDLENTPYEIGMAILRERLYSWSERDLKSLKKNPEAWSNPLIHSDMYEDFFERVMKYTSFDDKYAYGGKTSDGLEMARGGVEKISNSESRTYTENMIPFKANNLEGKSLSNGDYVVLSYGYYPIWWYCKAEGKWYGNSTKYSVTTSKHMSQSRPSYDATMLSRDELEKTMMKHSAKFEDGGMLDNILANTDVPSDSVGGTSFSSADLTPQMDITNPAF